MKMKKRYKPCLQCDNCLYIGEGDFLCDKLRKIVVEKWCIPTGVHCGKKGTKSH